MSKTAFQELMEEMDGDGKDTLLLIREMSELVSYYRRLLERFELDALTGLPGSNKYSKFRADLEKRGIDIGVIIFDVNDLKYYNDNKGHQAGDLLLQKAAESFHAICDDSGDINVFRTGGDEFVALITNHTESAIETVITKWKEKLAELNAVSDGVRCTIAHGSALCSSQYKLTDILRLADERMYAEKRRMKERGEKIGEIR